jgi:PKD repeat protein
MQIRRETNKSFWDSFFYIAPVFLILFTIQVKGGLKETTVKIADDANYTYYNPEVKIGPSGAVYVAYEAKNNITGRSDIFLNKYENGSVSFVKNISESSIRSYWPDIDIAGDGSIHAVWANQSGRTVMVKYRYFDGSAWSGIISFGQINDVDFIEDLRMTVDDEGNVFAVVSQFLSPSVLKFMSKYGDKISFEEFPFKNGRTKHADIAADKNHVHIIWQYYHNRQNVIAYSKRENKPGSSWEPFTDLKHNGCQRPRMSEGRDDMPQVTFALKQDSSRRKVYYEKWNGSKFDGIKEVSPLDRTESNNFVDMAAVDLDNVIVTMQQGGAFNGKNISYNWQQNGVWTGNFPFSATTTFTPTRQSIDLKFDRLYAALAFASKEAEVYLLLTEEKGSGVNPPTAAFTMTPSSGSSPLTVQFNASTSKDAGGNIKSYRWIIGGTTFATGKTAGHTFTEEGSYDVKLIVFDNENNYDEETGKVDVVDILPPLNVQYEIILQRGFLTWAYLGKVTWTVNPGNETGGIAVVKYNIYRKSAGEANYSYYDSVSAQESNLYYDRLGKEEQDYRYTVTAVDDQGRESALAGSSPSASSNLTPSANLKEK